MSKDCPKCNSQNRAAATFCDACGASLKPAISGDPSAGDNGNGTQRKTNFGGLIIVVVVIGVIGWLLFGPSGNPGTQATGGGPGQTENPHGGTESSGEASGANPHGGGDPATSGMGDEMATNIALAKTKLDANPLDIESLQTLYQTFGMIGRQDQIRPRLDAAVEALVAKAGDMEPALLSETLNGIAYSALYGNDLEGAVYALTTLGDAAPDNLGIMVLSGDIYFDLGRPDDAIAAYTAYLLEADAEEEGQEYWSARTDRATMFLQLGQENDDLEMTTKARDEFSAITEKEPDFFNAWFNLGLASKAMGDETGAEAAWETCVFLASNEMEGYQVDKELAALRGEDPPPVPESLRQPAGGGGSGMANPHGGGGAGAGEGTETNPHSEEDH